MNKKLLVLLPTVAMLLAGCTPAKTSSQAESAGTDVTSAVQSQDQSNSQGGSSATQEVVSEVQIDPTSVTLDIGGTKQINGVVKPATLSNRTIVWSSDKPEVATVSDGGLVTAKGAGVARIKAASQLDPTKFVECVVTVNGKKVLGYAYTPVVGQKYAFGTYQANSAVKANIYATMAKFDEANGRFETTKNFAEAAQFTLENGSANGKYRIKVSDGTNNKYLNLRAGDYHITLGDTAVTDWSWNEEYCTLVTDGGDRTNFVGTYNTYTTLSSCDILQAAGDYIARLYQQADPTDATAIDIYPNQNLTCYAGAALNLQARISPIGAQDKTVTWSVSGNDKCTINNGKLVAGFDATGTVKVTAKINDTIKKEVTVTIGEKLNFGTKEAPLTTAQAKALLDKVGSGIITEHQMYVKGIVASSSYSTEYKNYTIWLDGADKNTGFELYSTITGEGVEDYSTKAAEMVGKEVVAVGYAENYSGTYELTSTGSGENKVYPTILSISTPSIAPTSITLNTDKVDVDQGGTVQLTATLAPLGATGTIEWSVTGNDKVTIDQTGLVTAAADAVADSKATVTAKCGTLTATCVVTVKGKSSLSGESFTTDFTTKSASCNKYYEEWSYGDIKIYGGANNAAAWACVKMGPKAETLATLSEQPYMKTAKALTNKVGTVDVVIDPTTAECYNKDSERVSIKVVAYSDSAMSTIVDTSSSQQAPALAKGAAAVTLTFKPSTGTSWAENLYYKVVFETTNTTTNNGVTCVSKLSFNYAA